MFKVGAVLLILFVHISNGTHILKRIFQHYVLYCILLGTRTEWELDWKGIRTGYKIVYLQ